MNKRLFKAKNTIAKKTEQCGLRITGKKEEALRVAPSNEGVDGLIEKFSNLNPFKSHYLTAEVAKSLPTPNLLNSIDLDGSHRSSELITSASGQFEATYLAEHESYLLQSEPDLSNTLSTTRVTPHLRAKMVDWMLEVFQFFYNSKSIVTYFRAIGIMDLFLKNASGQGRKIDNSEVHLIGTTCMFIASKMEEVYHIPLEDFEARVTHGKITESEIKKMEKDILEVVDYNIAFPSSYNFLCIYFHKYFESSLGSDSFEAIKTIAYRILKLVNYDVAMNDFKAHTIAISAVIYSIDSFFEELHVKNPDSTEQLNRAHKKIIKNIVKRDFVQEIEVKQCFFRIATLHSEFDETYGKQFSNYKIYLP